MTFTIETNHTLLKHMYQLAMYMSVCDYVQMDKFKHRHLKIALLVLLFGIIEP